MDEDAGQAAPPAEGEEPPAFEPFRITKKWRVIIAVAALALIGLIAIVGMVIGGDEGTPVNETPGSGGGSGSSTTAPAHDSSSTSHGGSSALASSSDPSRTTTSGSSASGSSGGGASGSSGGGASSAGGAGNTTTTDAGGVKPSVSGAPDPTTTPKGASSTPTTAPRPTAQLFQESGSGSQQQPPVTVSAGDWVVAWSYDQCPGGGNSNPFSFTVYKGTSTPTGWPGPNVVGQSGSGTDEYLGEGTFSFKVVTPCQWTLTGTVASASSS